MNREKNSLLNKVLTSLGVRNQGKLGLNSISNERLFHALIEKSSDAMALIDIRGKILYCSSSTKRVLGYPPEEFLGSDGFNVIHSDDVPKVREILSDLVDTPGRSKTFQVRVKRKDAVWIWVESVITNLLQDPAVNALVVNFRDISKTKVAEQQLRTYNNDLASEKAKIEVLLGSLGDGMVATDKDGRIILVNRMFEELLGWKTTEVIGKNTYEIFSMEDDYGRLIPENKRPLTEAFVTGKKISATHYLLRKNGTKFPASVTATPVVLNGKTIGAVKIFHDVSREKEVDRAKTEFVSLASHQLRTPLTVVKWYTKYLITHVSKVSRGRLKEYLNVILQTNNNMVDLVNAILNVSRIDLGTLAVEPEPVFLPEVLDQVLSEFGQLIKHKNLVIEKDYSVDIPTIPLDPKLMKVVFANLIANSIKYTGVEGKITLQLRKDGNNVMIAVSDTGAGIPLHQQSSIFTKLFRADNAIEIDSAGTGLGLYIVKSVIDQSGGKIWFESPAQPLNGMKEKTINELADKGSVGTSFYMLLPIKGVKPKAGSKGLMVS